MKKVQFKNRVMGPVVLIFMMIVCCGVSFAETKIDEHGKADADGLVMVENIVGSIQIIGWAKKEVKVEGTLSDEVEGLNFKTKGKSTIIEVKYPQKMRSFNQGADLIIYAPRNSRFEIESISCGIEIDKVTGSVKVEAISGDIQVTGDCDEIGISCISGNVVVNGDTRVLHLESISGDIDAKGTRCSVSVESITGHVNLVFTTFAELSVESVDSEVRVEGALAKGGEMELESVSGDITLVVPKGISAEFSIETFSGSINKAFGHKAIDVSKYAPGSEMMFVTGDGDGRVDISTFSGDVKIKH